MGPHATKIACFLPKCTRPSWGDEEGDSEWPRGRDLLPYAFRKETKTGFVKLSIRKSTFPPLASLLTGLVVGRLLLN